MLRLPKTSNAISLSGPTVLCISCAISECDLKSLDSAIKKPAEAGFLMSLASIFTRHPRLQQTATPLQISVRRWEESGHCHWGHRPNPVECRTPRVHLPASAANPQSSRRLPQI